MVKINGFMILIEGKNLTKRYKNREREKDAVRDVSFCLNEREILGIVGESGSGKSTLLRMIAGLERPDEGVLSYRGEEYQNRKPGYAGLFLQMIFQDAYGSFDPRLRMRAQIEEVRKKPDTTGELRELLKETLLDESLLGKRPRELSGGQCQRMSIVRALYSGAEIILCDEMTSALDVTAQAQIVRIFGRLRGMRLFASIIVSHDIALVYAMCDRIMVMKDGRIVEEGKTEEVVRNPKDEYTSQLIRSARDQSF